MPVFYVSKALKGRREYDDGAIIRWLRGITKRDADIVAAYEMSQPRTEGPLTTRDVYKWADELMESFSRQTDIGTDARQQYLRSVLTEKIRRIEQRCTGGGQGVLSAAAQGAGIAMWRVNFKWAVIKAMPVYPATWQACILTGYTGEDSKAKAFQAAQSLWPDWDFMMPRARKPHAGMVDAACIAEFASRWMLGRAHQVPEAASDLF